MKNSGAQKSLKVLIIIQFFGLAAGIGMVSFYMIHKTTGTKGRVTGILYTVDDSMVVIDGQLLKEGDTIYGATVLKIHADRVELKKAEHRWTQRIRESPNPAWNEQDKLSVNPRKQ